MKMLLLTIITTVLLISCESCSIPLTTLSASFSLSTEFSQSQASGTSGQTEGVWCMGPRYTDLGPWIQATFDSQRIITGLRLIGSGQTFVSYELESFNVSYSEDGHIWVFLREDHERQTVKVYYGITPADENSNKAKAFIFPYQITAMHLRLHLLLKSSKRSTCLCFGFLQPSEFCEDQRVEPSIVKAEHESNQYLFSTQKKHYYGAERYCRQFGGSLASIHTKDESQFVEIKVESLSDSSGCQQWWVDIDQFEWGASPPFVIASRVQGLHGSPSSIRYWSDGSVIDFDNFVISRSEASGVCLDHDLDWQWNYMPIKDKACFICKYSTNISKTPLILIPDNYIIYIQDMVTFVVLLNSSFLQSHNVSIQLEGQNYCSLELSQTLNFTIRNSYMMSKFELTNTYEGWKYSLFTVHPPDNNTFIISASTGNKTGTQQVISVTFRSNETDTCLAQSAINGTGRYQHLPKSYLVKKELHFMLVLGSTCVTMAVQTSGWSVERKTTNDTGKCLSNNDYDVVDMSNTSDYASDNSSLHIAASTLSNGYYRICCTISTLYAAHVYTKNICGFIKVVNQSLMLIVSPPRTDLIHYGRTSLLLDASASYDPNTGDPAPLSFTWTCTQSGTRCDFVTSMWPDTESTNSVLQLPVTDSLLEIPGGHLTTGEKYQFTVSVYSPFVPGASHTFNIVTMENTEERSYPAGHRSLLGLATALNISMSCLGGCSGTAGNDLLLEIKCFNCGRSFVPSWSLFIHGVRMSDNYEPYLLFENTEQTIIRMPGHFFNSFLKYSIMGQIFDRDSMTFAWKEHDILPKGHDLFITKDLSYGGDWVERFLVFYNDSSTSVSVNVGDYYQCTLHLTTLSPTVRDTYPLKTVLLTEHVDGLQFGFFDVFFEQVDTFTLIVTSAGPSPSVAQFTTIHTLSADEELACKFTPVINGTSSEFQTAADFAPSEQLSFLPHFELCSAELDIRKQYWSVKLYQNEDLNRCYHEDEFQLVDVPGAPEDPDQSLVIQSKDLQEGYYRICARLEVTYELYFVGDLMVCGYNHFSEIQFLPLILVFSPNVTDLTHQRRMPLIINASSSYDPNSENKQVRFTWTCLMNNQQCDFVQRMWTGVDTGTQQLPVTNGILEIQGKHMTKGETYIITVSIESETMQGVPGKDHTVTVTAEGDTALHLSTNCESGCGSTLESAVSVQMNCSNCIGNVTYTWTIEDGGGSVLEDSIWMPFAMISSNGDSLVLPASIFNPLKAYNITIFAYGTQEKNLTGTAFVSVPSKEFALLLLPKSHHVSTETIDLFLILVNTTSSPTLQVTYSYTCVPYTSVLTHQARTTYPLTEFSLPSSTEQMKYSVISHQFTVPGTYNVSVSMSSGTEVLTYTSPINVLNEDDHHCLTSLEIIGTGTTLETARVYRPSQHIHFTSRYSGSCVDIVIISYNWTVDHEVFNDPNRCVFEDDFETVTFPESHDTEGDETFHVAAMTLPLGYNRLCLEITFVSSSSEQHQNRGCGFLKMVNDPLVVSVSPRVSFLTLPSSRSLVLNASSSYNPNSYDQADIRFLWTCEQNRGPCDFVERIWPGQNVQATLPITDPVLTIPPDSLSVGAPYDFSIAISKTGLEGANTSITVFGTNPTTPSLVIWCIFGCELKLNPSERLALMAVCMNCDETGMYIQSYTWSVFSILRGRTLSPEDVIPHTTTGIHQSDLVLSAYILNPSDLYAIEVTGTNSYSENGSAIYIVTTNSPPMLGNCSITPQTGEALITHFTISCMDFDDHDLPLVYKVYREKEDEGTSQLLFHGFESTISHLSFPTGPASTNYTHNVTISVFDLYNTSTSVHILVQVLAPQETNKTVSQEMNILVHNFSAATVHSGDSQDILRFAGSVASILNDEKVDSQNDSIDERAEARETILTTLSTVGVDSEDTLEQMTDIVGDLTAREELTDNIQDLAVNVSSQLTESLGAVAEKAPTAAKTIAEKQLSTLENLIEVTVAKETETQGGDTSNATTTALVEDKAKPILNLYEKIGDAMLKGVQFASEEPLKIEAKKTSLALKWSPVDTMEDVEVSTQLEGGEVEGKFQIPLKSSIQSNSNISASLQAVNFQVQVMSNNPYVWDDSAAGVNMPVVNIIMKSRDGDEEKLQLKNLPEPVGIQIKTSLTNRPGISSEKSKTNHKVNVTVKNNTIMSSTSHLVRFSSTETQIVRVRPINHTVTLQTFVVKNTVMTAAEIREKGQDNPVPEQLLRRSGSLTQDPYQLILPKLEGSNNVYYSIGFTVKFGQYLESGGKNVSTIMVSVETYSVTCNYWDEDLEKWRTDGCQVSNFSSLELLHCLCDHLTAFSGGIFVSPNIVSPIQDFYFFLEFFENPVVVTAVIAVWGVYLLLLYWVRQKDKEDAKKVGMTVLRDNDPQDKYVYLICVVTSWWPQAGTTANVFLYLRSRYRQSARHNLSDPERKLFTPGAENWFVLTTPKRLGKIKSVVVWHDNNGKNPSWFLKEVVVFDIQTKEEWHCLYDDWLAVNKGTGFIYVEVPSLRKSDMINRRLYQLSLKSSQDFRNTHLWISIFSKPSSDHFTRAQRLTCALSLLLSTMLSSIMFFGVPTDDPEDQVERGGMVISLSSVVIGIQSGLLMFPINTFIIQLFMKTAPKESPTRSNRLKKSVINSKTAVGEDRNNHSDVSVLIQDGSSESKAEAGQRKRSCLDMKCCMREVTSDMEEVSESYLVVGSGKGDGVDVGMSQGENTGSVERLVGSGKGDGVDVSMTGNVESPVGEGEKSKSKKTKEPFRFPWWFIHIAWTISLSVCFISSYFVMLYGLKYGYSKSVDWIVSFFTAFAQSAFVTQPFKVMFLAVLLTQILGRPAEYESWALRQDIEKLIENNKPVSDGETQKRYYVPPLSVHMLEEIRKRIKLEMRSRMILYEIGLYFTFVAVVLLMIYGHRDIDTMYKVTRTTEIMFTENTGFSKVSTVDSMWKYLQGHFIDNLVTDDEGIGLTSCQASYLLGKARLRQLRVKSGLCSHPVMKIYAAVPCNGPYWIADEDTRSYNTSWTQPLNSSSSDLPTAYTYQSAYQLITLPFVGKLSTYSGGGFVQELPKLPNDTRAALTTLMESDWIDQYTRAVFVEFTLYNPNVNLFSVLVLAFEFTNFGGLFPYYQIFTSNLYHYNGSLQIFVAVCEVMFLIYLIVFMCLEIQKFRQMTLREYFSDMWSYVEIAILSLSFTTFGLFIQRIIAVEYSLRQYKEVQGQSFVSFYPAAWSDVILQYIMATLSIFIIIKFFKLLRFNVRMSLLAGTIKRSKGYLMHFLVQVFIVTFAFASFCVLVFGTQLSEYSSFGESIITLFNFALGASDYFGLEGASRTFGPMFFFLFSGLYQFLLIMMFTTILMDGYASMMAYVLSVKTEIHMVEFIIKKIKLLIMTNKKKKNTFRKYMYELQTDR